MSLLVCNASVSVTFSTMDKYVKIRKIGEGSFGNAFLVKAKDKDRHLVMKEINMTKVTKLNKPGLAVNRDCNPGLNFSIPGFGIGKIPNPGIPSGWRNTVWAYTTTVYLH